MKDLKKSFRHESLQQRDEIVKMLKAITKGLASGELLLSDGEDDIKLKPRGLIHLKVKASQVDVYNKLSLDINWQDADRISKKDLKLMIESGS